MPSNSERINHQARMYVDEILQQLRHNPDGMNTADLIRQTVLQYPVSTTMVRKFIKECYIEPKYIKDTDGILTFENAW